MELLLLAAEKPPSIDIAATTRIPLTITEPNRNYVLPIRVNGSNINSVSVSISQNGSIQNSTLQGSSITIPMPRDGNSFVEVL